MGGLFNIMVSNQQQVSILYHWNNRVRSARAIARMCNISLSTVQYNLKKLATSGNLERRRSGKKRHLITPHLSVTIGQMIRRNNETTAKEMAEKIHCRYGLEVSRWTVQRHLKRIGYCSVLPHEKPMLTEDQRRKRLEWARCHKDDDWSRTIFSDETSVQLFRNTVRRWSKYPAGEVKRVPKCRQKVMIWGAIGPNGTIGLCLFRETMTAAKYINILKVNLLPAARRQFHDDWRLQRDNDPKHTARITKVFMDENVPSVMDWPSNSPDLNPIENVWAVIKKHVEKRKPQNIKDLERKFMEEWAKLGREEVNLFLGTMKQRCEAVISANGNHIPY
jgi:transposase